MTSDPSALAALTRLDWPDLPRRLTMDEATAVARVSLRSVRRWIACGYIRALKPAGGRVLIDRDSLRAFIEGEPQPSTTRRPKRRGTA